MKRTLLVLAGSLIWGGVVVTTLSAGEETGTFGDFMRRDRDAFGKFRSGKKAMEDPARQAPAGGILFQIADAPEESAQRHRARELYDEYCRLQGTLDNPDPKKGYDSRIRQLREKLFPTNRAGYDRTYWSDKDWYERWPFLQDLEVRAAQRRIELDALAAKWVDEGFQDIFYLPLDKCYGRKSKYVYLDKTDPYAFPSPIRTHMVDYVYHEMDRRWPTNAPAPQTIPPPSVIHENPPPPDPEPPELDPIAEEIREENVATPKPWDEMTPEERRRALMENSPEAWSGFCRDMFGTDTNGNSLVEAVLACSNVTAVATNIAVANLPPPIPVPVVKPWDEMSDAERYEALKANRCEAWDAVLAALLSGEASRTDDVLRALSAKPAIPDVARQTAYWHGYQVGQMEAATQAEESTIDMVVAAYKIPELMDLVREGYDDAKAGRPQKYGLPDPGELQQHMVTPSTLPSLP